MKTNIFTPDRINALIAAFVLIGIALVLVGVWRYLDATQQLQDNIALQVQQGDAAFDVNTPAQVQGLIAADIQKRRLNRQQNESLIMAGIGLGTLAIGWIVADIARGRRRAKSQPDAAQAPAEDGA